MFFRGRGVSEKMTAAGKAFLRWLPLFLFYLLRLGATVLGFGGIMYALLPLLPKERSSPVDIGWLLGIVLVLVVGMWALTGFLTQEIRSTLTYFALQSRENIKRY